MKKERVGKRRKKEITLRAVFWRYLLTTGLTVAFLCFAALCLFQLLVNMGFVLPAYTAANGLGETAQALQTQAEFDPDAIPHYYRWALVEEGEITASNMTGKEEDWARRELAGESLPRGLFYPKYYRPVDLPQGGQCLLQFDYSVAYAHPARQESWPDFQGSYLTLWGLVCLLAVVWITRRYARVVDKDAQAIAAACDQVAARELEAPFPQAHARTRELGRALDALDQLRQALSRALREQWAAQEEQSLLLAALAHDLKTPLTVVGGNAELLAEEGLPPAQQARLETILRAAGSAQDYVASLGALAAGQVAGEGSKETPLAHLAAAFETLARDLAGAAPVSLQFVTQPDPLPPVSLKLNQAALLRGVENLLSNALRYTPEGGGITCALTIGAGRLTLSVQDSGPGFSPEALARAGKTFYTTASARPRQGHLGLGLYAAAQTAKAHGGGLSLENREQGAWAALWLPLP